MQNNWHAAYKIPPVENEPAGYAAGTVVPESVLNIAFAQAKFYYDRAKTDCGEDATAHQERATGILEGVALLSGKSLAEVKKMYFENDFGGKANNY